MSEQEAEQAPQVEVRVREVPDERFQEVVAQKRGLEAELAEAQKQIQALTEQNATGATIAASFDRDREGFEASIAGLREELGLSRAGLSDPRGVAVARAEFGVLPEDERPATLAEWVQSFKADDAPEPPPGLAAYLKISKPKPAETRARFGSAPNPGASVPNGKTRADAASLRALRESGDLATFNKMSGAAWLFE